MQTGLNCFFIPIQRFLIIKIRNKTYLSMLGITPEFPGNTMMRKSTINASRNGLLLFFLICSFSGPFATVTFASTDLIFWERFKISPELILMQGYDDNIYLSESDEIDDFITSVLPGLDMQFAFSSTSRLFLTYVGVFNFYNEADNFQTDHHYASTGWQVETEKGSTLEIGSWIEDSAYQPYAIDDRSKPFRIGTLYIDMSVPISEATQLYANYHHSARRYDDTIYEIDNYDIDYFLAGIVNSRSSLFPLLLEYRYKSQQNDDAVPRPTNFTYHAPYTGFKWRQTQRLSGTLKVGYVWSEFNDDKAYDGWATDTDLTYAAGPFTSITATFKRGVRESTRTSRETLDYYVYAGGGFSFIYTGFTSCRLKLYGGYENRDYRSTNVSFEDREDNIFIAGITSKWRFKDWFSVAVGYRYRENDSNLTGLSYLENRIFAEIILFSTGDISKQTINRRPEQFGYF